VSQNLNRRVQTFEEPENLPEKKFSGSKLGLEVLFKRKYWPRFRV
jgi:hypothetical protein